MRRIRASQNGIHQFQRPKSATIAGTISARTTTASTRMPAPRPVARIGGGLSDDEIAARLFLSPLTAKTHVSRTMSKIGARDRAQLVVLAYESGLVVPGMRDP